MLPLLLGLPHPTDPNFKVVVYVYLKELSES